MYQLTKTNTTTPFRELKYGTLFSTCKDPETIWCKTPLADMYEKNNEPTESGAFCTAVRIDATKDYMQCNPEIRCHIWSLNLQTT